MRLGLPAGIALLVLGCTAAPAGADSLSSGRTVTPAGARIDDFSLATSPAGGRSGLLYRAEADVSGAHKLLFARLGAGRNLGPVRRLEAPRSGGREVTVFDSRIAVSADGGTVAAWVARGRVAGHDDLRVAIAPRGRGFGSARTLVRVPSRLGFVPDVAVDGVVAGSHGRAVILWTTERPSSILLRAAVRTRGGGFGRPQTLGPLAFGASSAPALALAPSGTVVAAGMQRGADHSSVRAATLRPGARRFGALRRISGDEDADDVGVFGGPGGAGVSWSDDRRASGALLGLRIARLRRDGTLAPRQTLALVEPGARALEVDGLQLGFPLAGPVAAWQVFRDISEAGDDARDNTRIDTAIGRGANVFHAAQTRTAPAAQVGLPVVGALPRTMLLAWPERLGSADTWHLRLAAHRSGGDWGPARTFADSDGAIAIAAGRRSALVLWQPFVPDAAQRVLRLAVYRP
ncbi:MAG: hypothetical protein QOE11_1559 [Solirubrobacteraceae bacterium]|jgi:hypothetical protein|nr:hypothetical protein [Solirubrobacteraceae bacterium]